MDKAKRSSRPEHPVDDLPAVSCMCLTYGRNRELEEAIESFLRQDYEGEKELIVLNDLSRQKLIFEHPEVRIVNLDTRCASVGLKRNRCAELARHDLLFVWDDDDIYLPHRLSHSVKRMQEQNLDFYKPDKGYYWNSGRVTGLEGNLFHSQSCFRRQLFEQAGAYPDMGSGQDWGLEKKIKALGHNLYYPENIWTYFYLYRWAGIESYHLSGFGRDEETKTSGEAKVALSVGQAIVSGKLATGDIQLKPVWRRNYQRQRIWFNVKYALQRFWPWPVKKTN